MTIPTASTPPIVFRQIEKLADKTKWMERFRKSYSGELHDDSYRLYSENVIFILAAQADKELGFIRINDKSRFYKNLTTVSVWNLTDAYIKPPYRSKGVLRSLVQHSVANYDVKMLFMQTDRFLAHQLYYAELGFTRHYSVRDGQLTWAFQEDFWPIVQLRNAQQD